MTDSLEARRIRAAYQATQIARMLIDAVGCSSNALAHVEGLLGGAAATVERMVPKDRREIPDDGAASRQGDG